MPFKSKKQMRYMYSQHPDIARRWTAEAKSEGKSLVQSNNKKSFKKKGNNGKGS